MFKFIKTANYWHIFESMPKLPEYLYIGKELASISSDIATHTVYPSKVGYNKKDGMSSSSESHKWTYDKTDIDDWVSKNVCATAGSLVYKEFLHTPSSNFYKPHVDKTRPFVMIYNVEGGGGDLVFWARKNKSIPVDTVDFPDYTELDELARVNVPDKTWYIINASMIHSIENLNGPRRSFQFTCYPDNELVKNNLIIL